MAKTYTIILSDADDAKLRIAYSDFETALKIWLSSIIDRQKSAEVIATVMPTDPKDITVSYA